MMIYKDHKNCECCPASLLIVIVIVLIVMKLGRNFLKGHKSLELLFVCQNQKVTQSVSDKVTYWAVLDS